MYTLTVQPFAASQFEKRPNDIRTDLSSARITGDSEAISSAGYIDVEAAFYLPQVLIKLAAKIGQAVVIGGFQDDVLRYLYGVQGLEFRPLSKYQCIFRHIGSMIPSVHVRLYTWNTGVHN